MVPLLQGPETKALSFNLCPPNATQEHAHKELGLLYQTDVLVPLLQVTETKPLSLESLQEALHPNCKSVFWHSSILPAYCPYRSSGLEDDDFNHLLGFVKSMKWDVECTQEQYEGECGAEEQEQAMTEVTM